MLLGPDVESHLSLVFVFALGSGKITVNGRDFEEYFTEDQDRRWILEVLDACGQRESVDVLVRASGGGNTGQSGAVRMGLARGSDGLQRRAFRAASGRRFSDTGRSHERAKEMWSSRRSSRDSVLQALVHNHN